MTICLGPPLPAASSGTGGTERERWPTLVPRAEALALLPAGVYRAGTSRCRWCALTAPLHPYLCGRRTGAHRPPSAVCFCGTVLTVARTGHYPAGLAIGEPGLSSTGRTVSRAKARQRSTDRDHLGCFPGIRLPSRPPARCPLAMAWCWMEGSSLAISWLRRGCSSAG